MLSLLYNCLDILYAPRVYYVYLNNIVIMTHSGYVYCISYKYKYSSGKEVTYLITGSMFDKTKINVWKIPIH